MSADNWGICPKCKAIAESNVKSAYGKVSEAEYLTMLEKRKKVVVNETLREDFEVYTDATGLFHVGYFAICEVCGFEFKYKHEQQIYPEAQS